ncbi:hypothetical protein KI387_025204, partial [Taxus chinensis]
GGYKTAGKEGKIAAVVTHPSWWGVKPLRWLRLGLGYRKRRFRRQERERERLGSGQA